MEACYACGASVSADSEWCGQCYAPRGRASSAPTGIMAPTRHVPAPATLPPQVIRTRWRKTTTTFGPVGRVLATVGLVVPFLFFVVAGILTGGMTIFGAGIWGFVVMPWGLRDVWRAGQLPAR
jgi:anti-sigma factor RsiW